MRYKGSSLECERVCARMLMKECVWCMYEYICVCIACLCVLGYVLILVNECVWGACVPICVFAYECVSVCVFVFVCVCVPCIS